MMKKKKLYFGRSRKRPDQYVFNRRPYFDPARWGLGLRSDVHIGHRVDVMELYRQVHVGNDRSYSLDEMLKSAAEGKLFIPGDHYDHPPLMEGEQNDRRSSGGTQHADS